MKNQENSLLKFDSLSDAHRALGLPKPAHPLISLFDSASHLVAANRPPGPHVLRFYKIAYRAKLVGKLKYGQGYYDFDEGGLLFASPNQIIGGSDDTPECFEGYTLLIHPDFLINYPLAKRIKQYGFFSYSANEALHLSDKQRSVAKVRGHFRRIFFKRQVSKQGDPDSSIPVGKSKYVAQLFK